MNFKRIVSRKDSAQGMNQALIIALAAWFSCTAAIAGEAQLSVANVLVPEGNSGTTEMNFSVVRSGDTSSNIVVGSLDLVTTNFDNATISILLGDGAGNFAAPYGFGVGQEPIAIAVADFNRDGKSDLAVSNLRSDTVSILLGNGSGGFTSRTDLAFDNPSSIASADFNGDGITDIAVAAFNLTTVSILLGNGDGSFGVVAPITVSGVPSSILAVDFNGDGKRDLEVAVGTNVAILLGDGNGGFGVPDNFSVGDGLQLSAADFNGDGKRDLAVTNFSGVTILLNSPGDTAVLSNSSATGTILNDD